MDDLTAAAVSLNAFFLASTSTQLAIALRWFLRVPRQDKASGSAHATTRPEKRRIITLVCGALFWCTSSAIFYRELEWIIDLTCRLAAAIARTVFLNSRTLTFSSDSTLIGLTTCTSLCSALALLLIYASIFFLCAPNTTLFRRFAYVVFLIIPFALSVSQTALLAYEGVQSPPDILHRGASLGQYFADEKQYWDQAYTALDQARHLGTAALIAWIPVNAIALFEILHASKAHSTVRRSNNLLSCLTIILKG